MFRLGLRHIVLLACLLGVGLGCAPSIEGVSHLRSLELPETLSSVQESSKVVIESREPEINLTEIANNSTREPLKPTSKKKSVQKSPKNGKKSVPKSPKKTSKGAPKTSKSPSKKKSVQKSSKNTSRRPSPVIIGGQEANEGDWPWVVSLQYPKGYHLCTGSLISDRAVLTAAHCIQYESKLGIKATDIVVRMGTVDRFSPLAIERKVLRVVLHPRWNSTNIEYGFDVAVLQLAEPVLVGKKLSVVPLVNLGMSVSDRYALVAGWGRTNRTSDEPSKFLHIANLHINKPGECIPSVDKYICTGSPGAVNNICYGDSGGPLMVQNDVGLWVIAGISSHVYGRNCDGTAYYASVSWHRHWIDNTVKSFDSPLKSESKIPARNIITSDSFDNIPSTLDCGKSPKKLPINRVVDATTGDWPWIVSLRDFKGRHFCAGSLIQEDVILTAAHCFANGVSPIRKADEITIHMGSVDRTSAQATERTVAAIVLHEKWDPKNVNKGYDVAVLRLKEVVRFDDSIRPICLGQDDTADQLAVVAGWGTTQRDRSDYPTILRGEAVQIYDQQHCQEKPYNGFCTALPGYGINTCNGDLGGPLMVQEANGTWTLAGIISHVYGNCHGEAYFTRVWVHRHWIRKQIIDQEVRNIENLLKDEGNLTDRIKSHLDGRYGHFRWVVCAANSSADFDANVQMSAEDVTHWDAPGGKDVVIFRFRGPTFGRNAILTSDAFALKSRDAFQSAQKDANTGNSLRLFKAATKYLQTLRTLRLFVTKADDVQCSSDEQVSLYMERIGKFTVVIVDKWQ